MQPAERRRLQQIEESLRDADPDLDAFVAGRVSLRRARPAVLAVYLAVLVILVAGLTLHVLPLLAAGIVAAPLTPLAAWLLIRPRRH
jgi:Flp pilus assembly protein TadB